MAYILNKSEIIKEKRTIIKMITFTFLFIISFYVVFSIFIYKLDSNKVTPKSINNILIGKSTKNNFYLPKDYEWLAN